MCVYVQNYLLAVIKSEDSFMGEVVSRETDLGSLEPEGSGKGVPFPQRQDGLLLRQPGRERAPLNGCHLSHSL